MVMILFLYGSMLRVYLLAKMLIMNMYVLVGRVADGYCR